MKKMSYIVIVAVACVIWLLSQIGGCQERKNREVTTNPEKEYVRPVIDPNNTKVVVGYHEDKEGGEVKNTAPQPPQVVTTPTCPYDGWKFCYDEGGLALFGPISNTLVSEDHTWKKAKREQNLMRQWFKPQREALTVNKQGLKQTEILPIASSSKFTSYTTYPIIWEVDLNNPAASKKRQKVQILMSQDSGPCKTAEVQPNGDLYKWEDCNEQAKLALLSFAESVRFVYLQGYEDRVIEVGCAPVAQEVYVSKQPPPAVTLPATVAPPTTTPPTTQAPAADVKSTAATTPAAESAPPANAEKSNLPTLPGPSAPAAPPVAPQPFPSSEKVGEEKVEEQRRIFPVGRLPLPTPSPSQRKTP